MKGSRHVYWTFEKCSRYLIQLFLLFLFKSAQRLVENSFDNLREVVEVFREFLSQSKVDLILWFFLLAPGYLPCKNQFLYWFQRIINITWF